MNHSSEVYAFMLRVFTDDKGKFGDVASVVVDEQRKFNVGKRIEITRKLKTVETAFIDDVKKAEISIMHYDGEIDFAGVAALAAAYVMAEMKQQHDYVMHGRKGAIQTRRQGELTWVRASLDSLPPWKFQQLESPEKVLQISESLASKLEHTMVWAWKNETMGQIKARTFAGDWGVPEAEGNGSGTMKLSAKLSRNLTVIHGKGSVIYTKLKGDEVIELGGRVVKDRAEKLAI